MSLFQRRRRQCTGFRVEDDLLAEYHQGRNRADVEAGGEPLLYFGIDLGKDDVAVHFRSCLEGWRECAAGTAPASPEIDDDDIAGGNGLLEVIFGELYCRHGRLLKQKPRMLPFLPAHAIYTHHVRRIPESPHLRPLCAVPQRSAALRFAGRRRRQLSRRAQSRRALAVAHGGCRSAALPARRGGRHPAHAGSVRLRVGWRGAHPEFARSGICSGAGATARHRTGFPVCLYPPRTGRFEVDAGGQRRRPGLPGTCRAGLPSDKLPRAWRLRVDDAEIAFEDGVQGRIEQALAREVGDFVLLRADGLFAYQLAVVVDDAEQGVTHVVRGADLLDFDAAPDPAATLAGLAYAGLCASAGGGRCTRRETLQAEPRRAAGCRTAAAGIAGRPEFSRTGSAGGSGAGQPRRVVALGQGTLGYGARPTPAELARAGVEFAQNRRENHDRRRHCRVAPDLAGESRDRGGWLVRQLEPSQLFRREIPAGAWLYHHSGQSRAERNSRPEMLCEPGGNSAESGYRRLLPQAGRYSAAGRASHRHRRQGLLVATRRDPPGCCSARLSGRA